MRSPSELFLLSSQIARASISLVSNYEFQILVTIHHEVTEPAQFDVSRDYFL